MADPENPTPTPGVTAPVDHLASNALPEPETFVETTTIPEAGSTSATPTAGRNIDAMLNVDLRVEIVLGHARMPISQLLKLSRGSVIELDRHIGEPVDVVINDRLVARADLVKLGGDRIGVSLTEIIKDYVLDT
ncbi:MAG: FliM/FliN family flagellar motor switch protein [Roseinatronobacter sp.]